MPGATIFINIVSFKCVFWGADKLLLKSCAASQWWYFRVHREKQGLQGTNLYICAFHFSSFFQQIFIAHNMSGTVGSTGNTDKNKSAYAQKTGCRIQD